MFYVFLMTLCSCVAVSLRQSMIEPVFLYLAHFLLANSILVKQWKYVFELRRHLCTGDFRVSRFFLKVSSK